MLMTVDQSHYPTGNADSVARNISPLLKAEYLRIVAKAVFASGVGGSGHGWWRVVNRSRFGPHTVTRCGHDGDQQGGRFMQRHATWP